MQAPSRAVFHMHCHLRLDARLHVWTAQGLLGGWGLRTIIDIRILLCIYCTPALMCFELIELFISVFLQKQHEL